MASATPPKPPSVVRNPVSLFGLVVTITSTSCGLPMMFLDMFSKRTQPYLGVLIYLILPFIAMGGVALVLVGVVWERHRRQRRPGMAVPPLPRLDLNDPRHQLVVVVVLAVVMTIVVLLSITGYRAYHFTESVQFCGLVCHTVMKPEYTAYQHSPHARVACVECHVGPGASWFVRSKLSGAYQVYAAATNQYPRPIKTPIKNLRPAQETCEQCHWPTKFFGAQQKVFAHTLADEQNSPWTVEMLLKVGGGAHPGAGSATGIHWHMNIRNEIDYVAADAQREVIPWVRAVEPDGRVTEYVSAEHPLSSEQLAAAEVRRMDCMDCHNRPSHRFDPPDRALDEAFATGRLDRSLPYLKREAIRLLIESYASEDEAVAALGEGLRAFYRTAYPELAAQRADAVEQAIAEVQVLYRRHFFPEMRVDWRVYPDHVGHLNSAGCFRCHDGLHRSADGKVITNDCDACHTILRQGPPEEVAGAPLAAQPFRHPVDVGMDVSTLKCSDCHTGTAGL